jgi:hypothetical protein
MYWPFTMFPVMSISSPARFGYSGFTAVESVESGWNISLQRAVGAAQEGEMINESETKIQPQRGN